jgi:hypothetical protein
MAPHEKRPASLKLLRMGSPSVANHAYLEINRGEMALELYCRGFFEASRLLLEACARNGAPVDTVFYPSVFLFRHGLELAFKALHSALQRRRGGPAKSLAGHALKKLWEEIREDVEAYIEPLEPWATHPDFTILRVADVDEIVDEMEALDASGEAFRYDRSRRGEVHLPNVNYVDLPQLRDVVVFLSDGILDFIRKAEELAEHEAERRTAKTN